jgi:predicted alpha/beta-hydrolase family hydrolase
MQHWKRLLASLGPVETLDYPYMVEGRKRPDPLPRLIEAHRDALHRLRAEHRGPVVLVGKSMGSRVGCHLSLVERVAAVICFGYPLCGAGDRAKLRDQVLREMQTPILFLQGTRDLLCPLDLLEKVRGQMTVPSVLHVVPEGDHSLQVTKRWLKAHSLTQDEVDRAIIQQISEFLTKYAAPLHR